MENQFELLKQRAEKGDAAAQWDLAQYYCDHPDEGRPYDWIDWARKAAEQGNPEAEVCVGNFCEEHLDEQQAVYGTNVLRSMGIRWETIISGSITKRGEAGCLSIWSRPNSVFSVRAVMPRQHMNTTNAIGYEPAIMMGTKRSRGRQFVYWRKVPMAAMRRLNTHWEGYMNRSMTMKRPGPAWKLLPNRGMLQRLNISVLYMSDNASMPAIQNSAQVFEKGD